MNIYLSIYFYFYLIIFIFIFLLFDEFTFDTISQKQTVVGTG